VLVHHPDAALDRLTGAGPGHDLAAAEAAVRSLCTRTGLVVDPTRKVADLSVGEAQRVEILKVLYRGARTLILDEPTAVLSPPEVAELWKVLRTLRAQGDTVVLITHKLDEVVDISDAVTVMRGGETVGRLTAGEATPARIAHMMVGRDVALAGAPAGDEGASKSKEGAAAPRAATGERAAAGDRDAPLVVDHLVVASARRARVVNDVTFSVRAGEIFGIAGVEGNGQTELIEAIAGLRPVASGSVRLGGREITAWDVRARADAGLSHVPEDRHHRGLVLDFSVLLASQPTRGVDVGAIEFIHAQLRAARDAGKAVLLVSADLVEVLSLADRVGVLYAGRLVVVLPRGRATPETLGPYMTGLGVAAAPNDTPEGA
jgi:simple sugar transport system ATP-binding protein